MKIMNSFKALGASAAVLSLSVLADGSLNKAHATGSPEPYLGSICLTAGMWGPKGYVEANGGLLSISDNAALYTVIGTTFGGNGQTTMGVPDLRGRSAIQHGTGPGLSPANFGYARGVETITPDINHLAQHSHAATFTPSGGGSAVSVQVKAATNAGSDTKIPTTGSYIGVAGSGMSATNSFVSPTAVTGTVELGGVSATGGGSGGGTVNVTTEGKSAPISNIPPQLIMRYCMAVEGLWPQKP